MSTPKNYIVYYPDRVEVYRNSELIDSYVKMIITKKETINDNEITVTIHTPDNAENVTVQQRINKIYDILKPKERVAIYE